MSLAQVCSARATAPAESVGDLNNISGLAPAGEGVVLAVADTKRGSDADRFALLSTGDGSRLEMKVDWPAGLATHDLEALCGVPGRPDEYLAFESGRVDEGTDTGGAVAYRVWMDRRGEAPTLRFVERLAIPDGARARIGDGEFDQIEGAAAWLAGGSVMVVLGTRMTGQLIVVELAGDTFEVRERIDTTGLICARDRRIGDLCVDDRGDRRVLYGVQADDPGDFGPFGSTIVVMASITAAGAIELGEVVMPVAVCDGLKVEGLCVPASGDAGLLMVGTDDEGFPPALRAIRVGPGGR